MSVVDTLWIINFSHSRISWTVAVVHVYSLEVSYEMMHRVVSPGFIPVVECRVVCACKETRSLWDCQQQIFSSFHK